MPLNLLLRSEKSAGPANDITVLEHDTNLTDIEDAVNANETAIATNVTNIAANDTDIATNVTNIATNVTDIATNTSAIATAAAPITPTNFSAGFTTDATDHGLIHRWNGTGGGHRVRIPDTLSAGTKYEIVASPDDGVAPLTIEKNPADESIRLGQPIGGRILHPGGRVMVVHETATNVRIEGDLRRAPMDESSAGASFRFERGEGISAAGGWLDQSGADNHADDVVGSPTISAGGGMALAQALDDDAYFQSLSGITYAGDSCVFGISFRVDAVGGSGMNIIATTNWVGGTGWVVTLSAGQVVRLGVVVANATPQNMTSFPYYFGDDITIGAAVFRHASAGFITGFASSRRGFEISWLVPVQAFALDWTAVTSNLFIGPGLDATQSFSGEIKAVEMRDDLTFDTLADASDQAHAMLGRMGDWK